jgi:hypothetical protein
VDQVARADLAGDPICSRVRDLLRDLLERWMHATGDPLLDGEVAAPAGATLTPVDSYALEGRSVG